MADDPLRPNQLPYPDGIRLKVSDNAGNPWTVSGNASNAKWIQELAKLEKKRIALHSYIEMKLEERDYHGIADAAMDLRELDARSKTIKEWLE